MLRALGPLILFLSLALASNPAAPLAAAGAFEGTADPRAFVRTTWSTSDGLPQNTISAILQTRDGYLWLGTFCGLLRFDGVTFTVFTVANTRELRSNRILALHEDPSGTLWIGTELGGVARYRQGAFLPALTKSNGLPNDRVAGIVDAPDGVWLATLGGVVRLQADRIVESYVSNASLPSNEGEAGSSEGAGGLWGCAGTLLHLKNGGLAPVPPGDICSHTAR